MLGQYLDGIFNTIYIPIYIDRIFHISISGSRDSGIANSSLYEFIGWIKVNTSMISNHY